jgi:lysozyme
MNVNARDLIKIHEGLRLLRYRCPAGHPSIGYGWNLDAWPLPPEIASHLRVNGRITEGMADYLLDIRIGTAIQDCRSIYPGFDTFTEARRAALTDFIYNIGSSRALKFKRMRAAIEAGDWETAAAEMRDSKWFGQVGRRAEKIVKLIAEG